MQNDHVEYFEPWVQFQQPTVRQLAFCIASPNLLKAWPSILTQTYVFDWHSDAIWQQHFQTYLPRLRQLDRQPGVLHTFLQQCKSTRLGLRFEQLLWFWLQDTAFHPYELIGHRLQQRQGKQTLGELDFLIKNHDTAQIEHWEVALKYYLSEQDGCIHHWSGLNREDTLQGKLLHFSQQQFQFVQANGYVVKQRYAIMKGQLFWAAQMENQPVPEWLNSTRRFGTWSTQLPPEDYYRLQRREWLCADAIPTSEQPYWYCNGLYKHRTKEQYQMLRLATPLTFK